MNSSPVCPRCGLALPADAPRGLCPRCLGAMSLEPDTLTDEELPTALSPLTPEELSPHFPQLDILECLGRGGMGVVYKARQRSLNRLVALKLLAPERAGDSQFAERFAQEAQALAQLDHPHIVTVHDFGEAGGFFYLLMEFVDGVNLRQALQGSRFSPEQALGIIPPVCEALHYAHENGIVHRDIKPENLLLDKAGRLKIADFGIARMLRGEELEETAPVGTPRYMAPEQRDFPQTADHRADIYSLGVVLYEMLTGELPDTRLQPPSRKVAIDARLDEIVMRALDHSPDLRWQTAAEMQTCVETLFAPPGMAESEPAQEAPPSLFWRRPAMVGAALTVVLALLGFGAYAFFTTRSGVVPSTSVAAHHEQENPAEPPAAEEPPKTPAVEATPTAHETETPPVADTDTATAATSSPGEDPAMIRLQLIPGTAASGALGLNLPGEQSISPAAIPTPADAPNEQKMAAPTPAEPSAPPSPLEPYLASFARDRQAIDDLRAQQAGTLRTRYLAALAAARTEAVRAGKGGAVAAVDAEIADARAEAHAPTASPDLPRTLAAPRREFLAGIETVDKAIALRFRDLHTRRLQTLDALGQNAAKQNDEALIAAVAAERVRMIAAELAATPLPLHTNVIVNGDFSDVAADGLPAGWQPRGADYQGNDFPWQNDATVGKEGSDRFLRFRRAVSVRLSNLAPAVPIAIPGQARSAVVSLRIRVEGFVPGRGYERYPGVAIKALDANGNSPGPVSATTTENTRWRLFSAVLPLQPGAKTLQLSLGPWAAAGTCDFDDVTVKFE